MSADNEIAVIKFEDDTFGVEHMISWDGDLNDITLISDLKQNCKSKGQLFQSEAAAMSKASELLDDLVVCEYGITLYEVV